MTVISPTELKDGDGDGFVTLKPDTARRLGQTPGLVLKAGGRKVESGWEYLTIGEEWPAEQSPRKWAIAAPNITTPLITGRKVLSDWGDGELSNVNASGLEKAIQVTKALDRLKLHDHRVAAKEWLYQAARLATIRNLDINRVELLVGHRGALVRGDSFGSIDNFKATFAGPTPTKAGEFPVGLQIGSKAQADDTQVFNAKVRLGDLEFVGFRTNYGAGKLAQGGGLTVESCAELEFTGRLRAVDCDEPFDIKAEAIIKSVESIRCSRSGKFWDNCQIDDYYSEDPWKRFPAGGATTDLVGQGVSPTWLAEHTDAHIPTYVIKRMEFAGDADRKPFSGRAGALMDVVIEKGNKPIDYVRERLEYAGKGLNFWYNGVQLRRRTL